MKVSQWAEIRRLVEVEKLSHRAVALRLRCCQKTVARALRMDHPPDEKRGPARGSLLDPWKPKIDALLAPSGTSSEMHWQAGRTNWCAGTTISNSPLPGVMTSPMYGCITRHGSDRLIALLMNPVSSVRCQDLYLIRMKWCRRS